MAKKTTSLYGKSQNNDQTRMNESMYRQMPDTLTIHEIKINGKVITTTLLNPKEVTRKEIGELYTKRRLIEVYFRFIKTVLQMDILRCKTPDMVRKEIWVHLRAYNLIRTVMVQTAHRYNLPPRTPKFPRHVTAVKCIQGDISAHCRKTFVYYVRISSESYYQSSCGE